ncbi:hypothetical protein T01_3242, partial [Trichinella spiralis]
MVEFWYRNVFRHYNGVFVKTANKSIFLHFWSISNKLTVRLILSKTNHIIEFYAVKKIHSFSFL